MEIEKLNKIIDELREQKVKLQDQNKELKAAVKKANVIIHNAANLCESKILKNSILLSWSSINLDKLL